MSRLSLLPLPGVRSLLRLAAIFLATITVAVAENSVDATPGNAANDNLLWLAVVTLGIGLGVGVWQLIRVRRSKKNHTHSSLANLSEAKIAERKS